MKNIIVGLVIGLICGLVSPVSAHDPTAEIQKRDDLIAAQESLLNIYRCRFNIDTDIVPGGCHEISSTTTPEPIPESTLEPTPSPELPPVKQECDLIKDHYYSQDRRHYFVEICTPNKWTYCEVNLLLEGRRTGKRGNEYERDGGISIVRVAYVDVTWDTFHVECS